MNRYLTTFAIAAILLFNATISQSQVSRGKWGFGLNAGGQKLYGDRPSGIGAGIEGNAMYRIAPMADLIFSLGYSQLKFTDLGFNRYPNLINIDLKSNVEIISRGPVRPFLSGGLGFINFEHPSSNAGRFFDTVFFGGGGLKLQVSPRFDWYAGADYRFTTGDNLDDPRLGAKQGNANDGYLNVRSGVTYYLPGEGNQVPQVIAMEKVPFDQLQEDSPYAQSSRPANETQNMEDYIRLKSRIDQLSEDIDSKENEISRLQGNVENKKQKVTSLSNNFATRPSVKYSPGGGNTGFAARYEEALSFFYGKNYSQAISIFQQLLRDYPTHSLAANCQYWIGESTFRMGQYQESIDALYKVLSYPHTPKKDDSLFLLGKSFLKMGSGERARESFSRLLNEYPRSEYAFEARDYISKL